MQKELAVSYIKSLREQIIGSFEALDTTHFTRKPWNHSSGGGGEIGIIRGTIFEKAAVNFSAVEGPSLPLANEGEPFFATGVSLITHMQNPLMPTVHMNVRYIETPTRWWFGGGYDLTPMGFEDAEDTLHFHTVAKTALDTRDTALYPLFKKQAQDYFYIPHRKKERGIGGIFFDHYTGSSFEDAFAMMQAVGNSFLPAIIPIYERKTTLPYTAEQKTLQNIQRGHYAEFNLAYDRGTRFGFQSGGNTEAILCSLPPTASW